MTYNDLSLSWKMFVKLLGYHWDIYCKHSLIVEILRIRPCKFRKSQISKKIGTQRLIGKKSSKQDGSMKGVYAVNPSNSCDISVYCTLHPPISSPLCRLACYIRATCPSCAGPTVLNHVKNTNSLWNLNMSTQTELHNVNIRIRKNIHI